VCTTPLAYYMDASLSASSVAQRGYIIKQLANNT
jgi:hypothetical protein